MQRSVKHQNANYRIVPFPFNGAQVNLKPHIVSFWEYFQGPCAGSRGVMRKKGGGGGGAGGRRVRMPASLKARWSEGAGRTGGWQDCADGRALVQSMPIRGSHKSWALWAGLCQQSTE